MFTVKQVSEVLGISPHALRFYDNEGLLPLLERTESRRRMFSLEDIEWVYTIQCWRATGMSVAEIKRYIELARIGDDTFDERHAMIRRQRDRAVEEVNAAKQRVKILESKVKWYEEMKKGANPNKWKPDIRKMVDEALSGKKKRKKHIDFV